MDNSMSKMLTFQINCSEAIDNNNNNDNILFKIVFLGGGKILTNAVKRLFCRNKTWDKKKI